MISLFSGAGGLDYGFEAAGFETLVAVEVDPVCCRVLRTNRPRWHVIAQDLRRIKGKDLLAAAGAKAGQVDVLIAGPPCQPFSKSAYWATGDSGRLEDPRAEPLRMFLRVLEEVRPRAMLLENVKGLAYRGKDEGLKLIEREIQRINRRHGTRYRLHAQVLNAADYGAPQLRERLFVVAARDGADFAYPKRTHAPHGEGAFEFEVYRTAWDAIGDLPGEMRDPALVVRGEWGDLLPTIPEGKNYLFHTRRGGGEPLFGWRTRYWSFLLKLAKDRPSWTLTAHPGTATGPFHWANRRLTIEELCRLQTFPAEVRVECSRSQAQRLLGNAVPSALGEVVAREVRGQILGLPGPRGGLRLVPARRTPVPLSEKPEPLPRRYSRLIGRHADHPGVGMGPGAQARRRGRRAAR